MDQYWVYPILRLLRPLQRVFFNGICLLMIASLYILGETVTTLIWGMCGGVWWCVVVVVCVCLCMCVVMGVGGVGGIGM